MIRTPTLCLLLLATGLGSARAEDRAVSLREQALYCEKVLGDIDRARDLYRRAWHAEGNRTARGLAAVRLARSLRLANARPAHDEAWAVVDELERSALGSLPSVRDAFDEERRLLSKQREVFRQADEILQLKETIKRMEQEGRELSQAQQEKLEAARARVAELEADRRKRERQAERRRLQANRAYETALSYDGRNLELMRAALEKALELDPDHADAGAALKAVVESIGDDQRRGSVAEMFVELWDAAGTGELRFYSISPLVARAAEPPKEEDAETERLRRVPAKPYPKRALLELLKLVVESETWGAKRRFARAAGEMLIVSQSDVAHAEVEALLDRLVAAEGPAETFTVEASLVARRDLAGVSRDLDATFRERDGVGYAVLDAGQLARWRDSASRRETVARRTLDLAAYRVARLERMDGVTFVLGRRGREPVRREYRRGVSLDLLPIPGEDGTVRLGVEGAVTRLAGPIGLATHDGGEVEIPASLRQTLALADEIPAGGAMLLVGLTNPLADAHVDDASLAILIARGGGGAKTGGEDEAASGGTRLEDLADARDFPASDFDDLDRRFAEGRNAPVEAAELARRSLAAIGLTVNVRDDRLVPGGDRPDDVAAALAELVAARETLVDLRVRALSYAAGAWPKEVRGREVAVEEGSAGLRAWVLAADEPLPAGGRERGPERALPIRSLQRLGVSRVERSTYVGDFDVQRSGGVSRYRPLLASVGRGTIVDARVLPAAGDRPAWISVVARAARVDGVEEIYPFGSKAPPAEAPLTTVRGGRVTAALPVGSRVVIAGFADPDGGPDDRLVFEVSVR